DVDIVQRVFPGRHDVLAIPDAVEMAIYEQLSARVEIRSGHDGTSSQWREGRWHPLTVSHVTNSAVLFIYLLTAGHEFFHGPFLICPGSRRLHLFLLGDYPSLEFLFRQSVDDDRHESVPLAA